MKHILYLTILVILLLCGCESLPLKDRGVQGQPSPTPISWETLGPKNPIVKAAKPFLVEKYTLTAEDLQIHGVSPGMPYDQAISTLRAFFSVIDEDDPDDNAVLAMNSCSFDNTVRCLTISGEHVPTFRGLCVGDPRDSVRELYGEGDAWNVEGKDWFYEAETGFLSVTFQGDTVSAINIWGKQAYVSGDWVADLDGDSEPETLRFLDYTKELPFWGSTYPVVCAIAVYKGDQEFDRMIATPSLNTWYDWLEQAKKGDMRLGEISDPSVKALQLKGGFRNWMNTDTLLLFPKCKIYLAVMEDIAGCRNENFWRITPEEAEAVDMNYPHLKFARDKRTIFTTLPSTPIWLEETVRNIDAQAAIVRHNGMDMLEVCYKLYNEEPSLYGNLPFSVLTCHYRYEDEAWLLKDYEYEKNVQIIPPQEEDAYVSGVILGQDIRYAVRALGLKRDAFRSVGLRHYSSADYPGMEVISAPEDNRVMGVILHPNGRTHETTRGIGIGSTRRQVEAAYGNHVRMKDSMAKYQCGDIEVFVWYTQSGRGQAVKRLALIYDAPYFEMRWYEADMDGDKQKEWVSVITYDSDSSTKYASVYRDGELLAKTKLPNAMDSFLYETYFADVNDEPGEELIVFHDWGTFNWGEYDIDVITLRGEKAVPLDTKGLLQYRYPSPKKSRWEFKTPHMSAKTGLQKQDVPEAIYSEIKFPDINLIISIPQAQPWIYSGWPGVFTRGEQDVLGVMYEFYNLYYYNVSFDEHFTWLGYAEVYYRHDGKRWVAVDAEYDMTIDEYPYALRHVRDFYYY